MKCYRGFVLIFLMASSAVLPAASVPNYRFQNIQPPGTSGGATALNNLGDVLISANNDTYLFHRGRYTLIRTDLGEAAMGLGVNARGTVVGFAAVDDSGGFVRTKSGEYLTFQFPPGQAP